MQDLRKNATKADQIKKTNPKAPAVDTYDKKRNNLIQQQQKQRKTPDSSEKSFKERLNDQLRMLLD